MPRHDIPLGGCKPAEAFLRIERFQLFVRQLIERFAVARPVLRHTAVAEEGRGLDVADVDGVLRWTARAVDHPETLPRCGEPGGDGELCHGLAPFYWVLGSWFRNRSHGKNRSDEMALPFFLFFP